MLAMDNSQTTPTLEAKLHEQLGEISREISRLVAEREALKRVLVRIYGEQGPQRSLPRPNSHHRILVEARILDVFRSAAGAPVSTRDLLAEARKSHPGLKEATFRSHLHRLMKRAVIVPHQGRRGHWRFQG